MIKKLKLLICFAAALTIGTQALVAQESEMSRTTNGRFSTDVDNYFSVNDWADTDFTRWFSYLEMQDITKPTDWQAGFALRMPKFYIGLHYNGTFNEGQNEEGLWGLAPEGPDYGGGIGGGNYNRPVNTDPIGVWTIGAPIQGSTHRNEFGVLIGAGDNGFKFTLVDRITVVNLPKIHDSVTNTTGYYQSRNGEITPAFTWGAAKDISIGKFTTRPSATVSMQINFNDEVVYLNGGNVSTATPQNSLVPGLAFDTGAITVWQGDWGKLKFGAAEGAAIRIINEGNNNSVPWENQLAVYSVFSYDVTKDLRLGAKVNVPFWFGWDGAVDGFFGVGQKAYGATGIDPNANYLPTLGTGFQYDFTSSGVFGNWVEKLKIDGKLSVNFGIKANLPGYLFTSTGVGGIENRVHQWVSGDGYDVLQMVSGGITFNVTKNFTFDIGLDDNNATILLSVKH